MYNLLSGDARRSHALRYSVAVATVLIALGLNGLLRPDSEQNPSILFLAAVAVSAWYGGLGPGVFATMISVPAILYFLMSLPAEAAIDARAVGTRLLLFGIASVLINAVNYERIRSEATLRMQRARLQITLASISDAVIATDTEGRVTFMNGEAERLTGWKGAEATGKLLREVLAVVDAETRQPRGDIATQVLSKGAAVGLGENAVVIARDGTERPIEDSGAPIRDERGNITGVVLVFRDVTERRQAEAERAGLLAGEQAARAQAEAAIRARDQFISIASHELRTPLTSLIAYTKLVQRRIQHTDALTEQDRHAINVVAEQATRLNRLVSSLLDTSRLETGQLSIDREIVDLRDVARRVEVDIKPTLTRHKLEVSYPGNPVLVEGDSIRLEQALQNLIQNAVRYSPSKGVVTMGVEVRDGTACLWVRDTGIGIPAEALPNIFDRFYRAPNVEQGSMTGMGLGLYVVKEIVTLHGGRIDVESSEGGGSTFTVCMPLFERRRAKRTTEGE